MIHRFACATHVSTVVLVAASMAPLACAGATESPEPTHRFNITEEDGVTVARTTGGPKYEGEIFTYEKVLELRPDESRPETMFYRAGPTALDDDGNLYVVDSAAHRISVFDAQGNWVRNIGREGQGPGEFQYPSRAEIVDGMLHVPDSRRRATHVFQLDGEFVGLEHWPPTPRLGTIVPEVWRTPTDGHVVRLIAAPREGDRRQERAEMWVFDEEGNELARAESPWVWTGETHWREIDGRRLGTMVFAHFAGQPWGGYVPGRGMWMTTGEEPVVWWYDLAGNLAGRWEVDLPLKPITDEDRAAVEANLQRALAEAREPPPPGTERPSPFMTEIRAANILFAEHKPYWGVPRVDDRGFFWVTDEGQPVTRSQPRPETMRWIVLSPEGEFLGYTTPPSPGLITGGHLLSRVVDPETEEPYPVVYRIGPAVEGLEYGG